jgi:hypothetical protein
LITRPKLLVALANQYAYPKLAIILTAILFSMGVLGIIIPFIHILAIDKLPWIIVGGFYVLGNVVNMVTDSLEWKASLAISNIGILLGGGALILMGLINEHQLLLMKIFGFTICNYFWIYVLILTLTNLNSKSLKSPQKF